MNDKQALRESALAKLSVEEQEALGLIKKPKKPCIKKDKVIFYHIGGYECLRDGTHTEICETLEDVQDLLDDCDMEYDATITDMITLVHAIEDEWSDMWDDGGGSGWIEIK